MRILSYLFLLLGLVSFLLAFALRFGLMRLSHYPVTFVEVSMLSVLLSISFGVLSLQRK